MTDPQYMAALGALATVITVLWRINVKNNEKMEKRADKIESKYDQAAEDMVKMSGEIGELRGQVGLAKELGPKIEALHNDFLKQFPPDSDD